MIRRLRDEALLLLEGEGEILEVARELTRILREHDVAGAVIGGVSVVLHGYVRTTTDVDVLVADDLTRMAEALGDHAYRFDRKRREFRRGNTPVHLVAQKDTRLALTARFVEIDEVRTVSLPDLINMKLTLGLKDPLRAIDLADVIGLIRARRLTPAFAAKLRPDIRSEFRKFARAVKRRG